MTDKNIEFPFLIEKIPRFPGAWQRYEISVENLHVAEIDKSDRLMEALEDYARSVGKKYEFKISEDIFRNVFIIYWRKVQ